MKVYSGVKGVKAIQDLEVPISGIPHELCTRHQWNQADMFRNREKKDPSPMNLRFSHLLHLRLPNHKPSKKEE
ncbi:hypothetical protein RIF29_15724 [Crotalaria pallida]|uniref:Uncharacterized protein n=1 Tax=Crotalaria pallida TaxID=3830 RepID=A0AAN9IBE9_CROPI